MMWYLRLIYLMSWLHRLNTRRRNSVICTNNNNDKRCPNADRVIQIRPIQCVTVVNSVVSLSVFVDATTRQNTTQYGQTETDRRAEITGL